MTPEIWKEIKELTGIFPRWVSSRFFYPAADQREQTCSAGLRSSEVPCLVVSERDFRALLWSSAKGIRHVHLLTGKDTNNQRVLSLSYQIEGAGGGAGNPLVVRQP